MKVGVIVPTRGDRPEFISNCIKMIGNQTMKPDHLIVMGQPPQSDQCDITYRYRSAYATMRNKGLDVIAFMEDDDAYRSTYLEYMVQKWVENGKPDLFGTSFTHYYHLKLKKWMTFQHSQKSSMMSTLIKPDLDFTWPLDHDPYTDQWLWMRNHNGIKDKRTFVPDQVVCLGIKHGMTETGGSMHVDHLHRYVNDDPNMDWLQSHVDPEQLTFYKMMSERLNYEKVS